MKIVYILLIFAVLSVKSYACSCFLSVNAQNEYKRVEVVLVWKVLKKDTIFYTNNDKRYPKAYSWSILIEHLYKGNVSEKTIKIVSGISDADCGFNFQVGENYIVYASNGNMYGDLSTTPKYLITTICTRTRLKDSSEIFALDKIKAKTPFDY